MAKLYWRIKRNGKWTWLKATMKNSWTKFILIDPELVYYQEEEE